MVPTLERVRELAPLVAKRADEIERARGLPDDLTAQLADAGCVRMVAPRRYGGDELPMPDVLRVVSELARADGSTGWCVGQVAVAQLVLGCCPEPAQRVAYAAGPDLFAAGAVAPKGRATATGDGWRISGQWPFVTGCQRATWFYVNCVVVRDRSVQTAGGAPETRIVLLPAADVRIVDTWRVLGLCGTGSHDVAVNRAVSPPEHGFTVADGDPRAGWIAANIAQSSLVVAAACVGIAQGAVADVAELARGGKRPAFSTTQLAKQAVFQDRLGEADAALRAAEALLSGEAAAAWHRVSVTGGATALERARTRAAAAQVIALARSAAETAYELGGGSVVYTSSPAQRRLRDMRTAAQHFVAGRDAYRAVGAALSGQPPEMGPF